MDARGPLGCTERDPFQLPTISNIEIQKDSVLTFVKIPWDAMSDEITNIERAFVNIFGFMPTYIRPPYLSCNEACMEFLGSLGYKVIGTDLDTKDYENSTPDMIWKAKENFVQHLNEGGSLSLAHDIHEQTVVSLTPHILETLLARGLRAVTVGECLGNSGDWYRGPR